MTGKQPEAASAKLSSPSPATSDQDVSCAGLAAGPVAPARRHGRPWGVMLVALFIGLALGGLGGRYWFKDQATRRYDALKQRLEAELVIARADLAKAQAHVDALSGSLMVEQSTRKGLETSLEAAQAELGRTREQLAFFDQLFPPGPKGAVSIRALDAELQGSTLQYRALFMRNAVNAHKFEGRMQFVAKGTRDGKPQTLTLEPAKGMPPAVESATDTPEEAVDQSSTSPDAASDEDSGSFALVFNEFQRSAGLLDVPEGFTPTALTLNVLEGDAVRATRTINLSAGD
ncbi:DUF6776 family protein [Allopusillimonas ginsengisoli]|uniref:DUF6776 family protein n=1 Tax=Allopusillimonas ginsengisoli TaxID=453575 RepID=UPI001021ADDA|nr:DUF6776 family protein [Allopusillimonas ginsengisoli]TEA79067.1 hypothetical protein ERE07_06670 [Allopusillimonas ginsengisoli]